jgi:hypothetical protein
MVEVSRVQRTRVAGRHIDLDARRAADPPSTLHISLDGQVTSGDLKRLGLDVRVEFATEPGRSKITSLTVSSAQGVTVNALRSLPLRGIEKKRDKDWAGIQRFARQITGYDALTELQELLAQLPDGERRRVPARFYELVASIYKSQVSAGFRTPSRSIAKATDTPLPTVQGWVRRARLRGLLPPARQGTAG